MEPPPTQNVRRALYKLRHRWESHSPVTPFYLCEEVEPGVTFSSLCVSILMNQRARRRMVATEATEATPVEDPPESLPPKIPDDVGRSTRRNRAPRE